MSVRMKLTHSKTGSRRSHHRAIVATATKTETGVRRRHFADPVTGMYRGKQILTTQTNTAVAAVAKKAAPKKEAAAPEKTSKEKAA